MQLGPANVHGSSAHMDAYNAGILHRDFSVGNIVIDPNGEGWLIDWDLSKPVSLQSEAPRRATRTVCAYVPPRAVIKANS
jgi:RIO-like serine/threonine protein kinase